jgi:hypothetical protein
MDNYLAYQDTNARNQTGFCLFSRFIAPGPMP